jgi:ketosteroid isomerase-like protein
MSEELVVRFFSALEAGDIETLREIYAPDAVIWHNDDLIEQPVDENLKVLRALPDGSAVELHAAMYLQVRDGHITRIEEYLDSGKRATIKAARDALTS